MDLQRFLFLTALLMSVQNLSAQIRPDTTLLRKFYKIGKEKEIFIPLGKVAFADTVITFKPGHPPAKKPFNDPEQSLGEPDFTTYRSEDPNYVSMGCGGTLILKFTDNGFIDIDGPDLVFFEVGPSIEPFRLEISTDGHKWYKLGHVSGGQTKVDIANFIRPQENKQIFYYVKLTDLKHLCDGPTPGADIDAVGAIGGVIKLSLDAKVLFDTDKFFLRDRAKQSLEKLDRQLREIPKARVAISGYTDSDGSFNYNMTLGKNRAKSVKNYLENQLKNKGEYTYDVKSYGKTHPVSDNDSPEGKQQNRRVEIIVFPDKDFYKTPEN